MALIDLDELSNRVRMDKRQKTPLSPLVSNGGDGTDHASHGRETSVTPKKAMISGLNDHDVQYCYQEMDFH